MNTGVDGQARKRDTSFVFLMSISEMVSIRFQSELWSKATGPGFKRNGRCGTQVFRTLNSNVGVCVWKTYERGQMVFLLFFFSPEQV